jgi:formylglycine-generating enzyme required for sulfatase activity
MANELEWLARENTDRLIDAADRREREKTDRLIADGARSSEMIRSTIVDATSAIVRAQYNNAQELSWQMRSGLSEVSWQMNSGLSEVSRHSEVMGANMLRGIGWLADRVAKSADAICDRLDKLNDIANNPSRTKARELYRRALTEYAKELYQEALEDALAAVREHQTDVVSQFLLGKIFLEGRAEIKELDEIVDVRDFDKSIEAFKNAARYILPDTKTKDEAACLLAAQIWFYLGSVQLLKSWGEPEAWQDYVRQAQRSFEQSGNYFQESRERLYVRHELARCKVLLGDVPGGLLEVKAIILRDPGYYKNEVENDPYFSSIKGYIEDLIKDIGWELHLQAKPDFEEIQRLKAELGETPFPELARLLGALPASFTEDLPYFAMREAADLFLRIKEMWREQSEGFVFIEGGTFTMGSPASEAERQKNEGPQHQVTVRSFYMGRCEVTQRKWQEVMGSNPSKFKGDTLPVEQVSWYDAIEYCNKRSQQEGLTPAYTIDKSRSDPNNKAPTTGTDSWKYDPVRWVVTWNRGANGYRLPTEAEWEYACRAGTTTPFNTGNNITTDQANYDGNYPYNGNAKGTYREKTMPVGSFAPNAWGLYDMHGNVWEWCWDWYGGYSRGSQTDPEGAGTGSGRVDRGGSWSIDAQDLRSAYRYGSSPSDRGDVVGFRLVRS